MNLSAEELSSLTPDEQEAVLAAQQPEVDASEQEAEPTVVTEDEPVADAVQEEAEGGESIDGQDDDAPVAVDGEFRPEFTVDMPNDLPTKLAGIDQRIRELRAKRDEGEIGMDEFDAEKDALDNERLELTIAAKQAEWAAKQNVEVENQLRVRETNRFFSQAANKMYSEDEILYSVLDATVRKLQRDPDTKDNGYAWHLEEANRQVRQRLAKTGSPVAAAEPPAPRQVPPAPRTIGGLPSAAPAPVGDDRAEKIGMLEGEDLEKYVGRLSADDRKKLSRVA